MRNARSVLKNGTTKKNIIITLAVMALPMLVLQIFLFKYFSKAPYIDSSYMLGMRFNQNAILGSINISGINNTALDFKKYGLIFGKIGSYSKSEKAGSLLMINVGGLYLDKNTSDFLNKYKIGGVIFMGGNIADANQVKSFIADIKKLQSKPLVAVDQEGYPVARIGWEKYAGEGGRKLRAMEVDKLEEVSSSRAKELAALGFDINFAPVADLIYANSWIENRSFGADPKIAAAKVAVIINAQKGHIYSGAKHFPGLGDSAIDSHEKLPVINLSREHIQNKDLTPFRAAIAEDVEFIMMGHGLYPQLDKDSPASVSRTIQMDLLRGELKFKGLIISDDMKMGALNHVENKYARAVEAGTNVVLVIDSRAEMEKAIGQIAALDEALLNQRLLELLEFNY